MRERETDGLYGTAFDLKNPTPPGAAQEVPVTSELERYLIHKQKEQRNRNRFLKSLVVFTPCSWAQSGPMFITIFSQ